MGLADYNAKRRFDRTPEPKGRPESKPGDKALVFVVQKHAASHLHYDFRLELQGVLKSWAVPKGPSLNPDDKRLAMMVEDHPFDYRTFEGTIPEGNYGAGTVMVWDQGTYHAVGTGDAREEKQQLLRGLAAGDLKFVLQGQKLKGEFALIKLKGKQKRSDNSWLLIKKRDSFATKTDVTTQDRSVLTGRTMEQIARNEGGRNQVHTESEQEAAPAKQAPARRKRPVRRDPFPHGLSPMLAVLADRPFDKPGWLFEIKWDGYRAIAELEKGKVQLLSRKKISLLPRYPVLGPALEQVTADAVLDGEIVVVDDAGRSSFALLQQYHNTGRGRLLYYVFDLLYWDGQDLRSRPLSERKELLKQVLPDSDYVRYSDHVEEHGAELFAVARDKGLEGIIGKEGASEYQAGVRSDRWLKLKTVREQEAVVGGFTQPRGSRKGLGALVLGVYEGDQLVYIGHTGGGLDTKELAALRERLEPLRTAKSPFAVTPKTNAPVTWVKPQLAVEVKFREWSADNLMRMPIFLAIRDDKDPKQVRRETPRPTKEMVSPAGLKLLPQSKKGGRKSAHATAKLKLRPDGPSRDRPSRGTTVAGELSRGRTAEAGSDGRGPGVPARLPKQVEFTHLDKVWFPDDGLTKGDVIEYYRRIAPLILPYLKGRPESLHRFPNGIKGKSFFQKDMNARPAARDGSHPDWLKTVPIESGSHGGEKIDYLVCDDEATLLYMINLGCIDLNPWNARAASLDSPDYCVIDLDPQGVGFDQVVQAARAVYAVLERAGAVSFCKTSGATGLHIYIPLGARYSTEQSVKFAQLVALLAHQRLPDLTTVERDLGRRPDGVYLDYLQNRRGQTLASVYSVRPRPGAPVSTPLRWEEVRPGLYPLKFTAKTIFRRVDRLGDLWRGVLGPGIDLDDCLRRLNASLPDGAV